IMAAIVGLKALNAPCRVTLYTDSEYVANAMSQSWVQRWRAHGWKRTKTQPALNADLWEELLDLCAQHEVTFVWTRGHAGDPENERCDRLARQARNAPDLPPDPGYPSTSHRLGPLFGATRLKI
ncbi:MAG: ribonuclease H, partial [Anaerolineae bacterium]|nr:ribonuclease HI [Thermoflexales bacterium]MDW8407656.1 ribonuclease H [Anaerolineae bacterium]